MDEFNLIQIIVKESGERIDALLARSIEGNSRNSVQKLLEEGYVSLEDGKKLKKNYKVSTGDSISVLLPVSVADIPLIPQDIPLDIRYEDNDVIVINKPRGLVVHPAPGHPDGTVVNALLYHCADTLSGIGGEKRPGIVHRIDKDTSGLLIIAKNDFAHRALSAQLSDHTLYREYQAIVRGGFKEDSGTVCAPIGRHPTDRKKMAVTLKNSKEAITHWSVISRYNGYTHIRCRLETGRTHQIRVHMSHIGHPLLGDITYGGQSPEKGLEGQCLHAGKLRFIHPATGKDIVVECPLPEYFIGVIKKLGNSV